MPDPILSIAQRRPGAAVQLLFLHHAGGSSYPYLQIGNQLSASIEPFCLELAGRGSRLLEPLQADPELTLSGIVAAIRHLGLGRDKPLLLFGHSLGAELAYQLADRLQRESPQMVLGLILSARSFVGPDAKGGAPSMPMSNAEILHLLQQYEGTPAEVLADAELRQYVIGVMRNDLALLAALCRLPKPILPLAAHVVGGDGDSRVPVSRLADWERVFAALVTQRLFPGGHFYLFSSPEFIPWLEERAHKLARQEPVLSG
ncbi:thioesterase II family protein [Massilia scottii]|uniref:thioesterase II family protein n=1 Tax=Massilia scottii TaxID=3057166 RepID=UPI0027967C64|nr:alpha/beta fold hydrolase [Massilia sp. CCM 9029]MDQ1834732.1 alpha/beta fold hydrolase [Massilia sp. CCM 9029]